MLSCWVLCDKDHPTAVRSWRFSWLYRVILAMPYCMVNVILVNKNVACLAEVTSLQHFFGVFALRAFQAVTHALEIILRACPNSPSPPCLTAWRQLPPRPTARCRQRLSDRPARHPTDRTTREQHRPPQLPCLRPATGEWRYNMEVLHCVLCSGVFS